MKTALGLTLTILVCALSLPAAFGATPKTERPLAIENGYVYTPLAGSSATAGYGTLINSSQSSIEITALSSKNFKAAEIHETKEENGLMKMKKLEKLVLKAGERFELKPGGNHLMLFEATKRLKDGETVVFTFTTSVGPVELTAKTQARPTSTGSSKDSKNGADGDAHSHHHH